jgi:hypothetical protein
MTAIDSTTVLRVTAFVLGIHTIVASVEYLVFLGRERSGLFDWEILQHYSSNSLVRPLLAAFTSNERLPWLMAVQLLAGVTLVGLALLDSLSPLPFLVIAFGNTMLSLRSHFGLDGAHQMVFIVSSGACVATVFPAGTIVHEVAIWYVAVQLLLSYTIAGIAKARSAAWRNGSAMRGISSTAVYGHPRLHRTLTAHPRASTVLCWGVILFELSFPLVLVLGPSYGLGLIAAGIGFHLLTALFMGLNGFLTAFLAAYPALFYVSNVVHQLMF